MSLVTVGKAKFNYEPLITLEDFQSETERAKACATSIEHELM